MARTILKAGAWGAALLATTGMVLPEIALAAPREGQSQGRHQRDGGEPSGGGKYRDGPRFSVQRDQGQQRERSERSQQPRQRSPQQARQQAQQRRPQQPAQQPNQQQQPRQQPDQASRPGGQNAGAGRPDTRPNTRPDSRPSNRPDSRPGNRPDNRPNNRYERHDGRWDRNAWRHDNRYDWRDYRARNRSTYRLGRYYSPYRGYAYRRLSSGFFLSSLFYTSRYWIMDPWDYRLPGVYGPYRWVRYYDDVLLVNVYTGEVVDVIYDFFW